LALYDPAKRCHSPYVRETLHGKGRRVNENAQRNRRSNGKDRIIVIGLDSADPDLMELWLKEGRLPFMHSLLQAGVWARLLSTRGLFPDSPWSSFNTGVSPAKHGWYDYLQLKRGTTEIFRENARACRYLPFWWLLRDAGKKVAVFDVPKTYPIAGIDGIQVVPWGEHYPLTKQSSLPPAVVEELNTRFGKYRHPWEVTNPRRIVQEVRLYNTMMADIDKKLAASEFLLAQDEWDLFISVFAESHYAGHQFFHHFEPSHWAHDEKRGRRLGHTLPSIYTELDSALAALLKGISEDATIFIISVHGIEPNYSANHLMPTILEKLGFLVPATTANGGSGFTGVMDWTRALRGLLPSAVRTFINDHVVPQAFHDRMHAHQFANSIDWSRTHAFFLPSDHFTGFISVNLQGREPWGMVRPGTDYEEVCAQLCYELKRLVNPATGRPAVHDVVPITRVYTGENLGSLPDVVVRWAKDAPIKQLRHPHFGLIADESFALRRSQHAEEGFMIAVGKHINSAAVLTGASTLDLAPTILYLMGQTVPTDMDGKVLLDLIDQDFKTKNEVRYGNRPLVVPEEMRL